MLQVSHNSLQVAPGSCAIMLIDQGRRSGDGRKYRTQDNAVHHNDMTFSDAPCAGGASDTLPDDSNFDIIASGRNRFDDNIYHAPHSGPPARFAWGRQVTDWPGFRQRGQERGGQLMFR